MVPLERLLEESRRELLDLSTRNRLLSMPVQSKSARIIEVKDELADAIFRLLVAEKKKLSFVPGIEKAGKARSGKSPLPLQAAVEENEEEVSLPQPDDEIDEATGMAHRHVDLKLQTALTSEGLQRRLLALYRDAQTIEEEQGVNILYLALGRLKWYEAEKSDTARFAPLLLVPVTLKRLTAGERFTLQWREEEVQENLSLAAKLKAEFGITLPKFPSEEDLTPSVYGEAIRAAVQGRAGWEVDADGISLGFFSFAKFLMYRDLDPQSWPSPEKLLENPFLSALLRDGFPATDRPFPENVHLDELIPAARLDHIVDADGSQSIAIERVRCGEHLVIQGPPGTGKSQSISNIIATAVLDGKRVLFVAEKLAALEVVKRRLEAAGLGDLCLELHSQKAHKRAVLEEIGRTWKLSRPRGAELEGVVPKLETERAVLNGHANALHTRAEISSLTPFQVLGKLAALGQRGVLVEELDLEGAETWTRAEYEERAKLVTELGERVAELGALGAHPWRGVSRTALLAIDLPPLERRLRGLRDALRSLQEASAILADALKQPRPPDFAHAELARRMGVHIASAPPLDPEALCNSVWRAGMDGLSDLVDAGRRFRDAATTLSGRVTDGAWEGESSPTRAAVAAHGSSLFRLFSGDYRRAIAALRGMLSAPMPGTLPEKLALLDVLLAGQRALRELRAGTELGTKAFGGAWRAERSDWEQLSSICVWVRSEAETGLDSEVRTVFAQLEKPENVATLAAAQGSLLIETWQMAQGLFQELELDLSAAFGTEAMESLPLDALAQRLEVWLGALDQLSSWCTYAARTRHARALGLASVVALLEGGEIGTDPLRDAFERAYYSQLLRSLAREQPSLAQFDGALHQRHVENFRQLDRERLTLSRYRVLAKHVEGLPSRHAGLGATGIVMGELERKRGHRPVRKLLKDAGSVVQAIKPVFMMSPLSVAQFLEPGGVEFDLLVIDEASQVQPVDALGAVFRSKQIVVVGDSRQLPPTRFFARLTSDEPERDDDEEQLEVAQARDVESILGLCCARGLPQTMLRWHYRSRHHSLIAVSNHEFYEDQLFIVPSPYLSAGELGLKFTHVPEGVFDSGASNTNRVEAKAVCRAILEHARQSPQFSLGIAAFSAKQREAILDELELLRRENPDLESFFHGHPHEPFFVKNLENVQGDERDVIFISVGYGPTRTGYLAMRFGPLSSEGGERRLNVLISRAKRRCEVFASLTGDDIDLARANGRGVHAFKTFLQFAQTGRFSVPKLGEGEEQSPFEEAVRRAVEGLGYELHPQVGVAGFFIDLGVIDSSKPGRYLLGIECDGAAYHSSRSARDRDRLRQAVLEDHGWILHRIWSTDWFQRPGEQLRKVVEALELAKVALAEVADREQPATAEALFDIAREEPSELPVAESSLSVPYVEASFPVPRETAPHELTPKAMSEIVFRIVETEGPIHESEVTTRVRELWGLGRAGSRIQDSVARGINSLLISRRCTREDECLSLPDTPLRIRNRDQARSPGLRKPEALPRSEVSAAITAVLRASHGAGERELSTAVARAFGFKSTSAGLRALVSEQIQRLRQQGEVTDADGLLRAVSPVDAPTN